MVEFAHRHQPGSKSGLNRDGSETEDLDGAVEQSGALRGVKYAVFHIVNEKMQQGEEAALYEDDGDVLILVNSDLSTNEKILAVRYLLIRRYGPLGLPVAV